MTFTLFTFVETRNIFCLFAFDCKEITSLLVLHLQKNIKNDISHEKWLQLIFWLYFRFVYQRKYLSLLFIFAHHSLSFSLQLKCTSFLNRNVNNQKTFRVRWKIIMYRSKSEVEWKENNKNVVSFVLYLRYSWMTLSSILVGDIFVTLRV